MRKIKIIGFALIITIAFIDIFVSDSKYDYEILYQSKEQYFKDTNILKVKILTAQKWLSLENDALLVVHTNEEVESKINKIIFNEIKFLELLNLLSLPYNDHPKLKSDFYILKSRYEINIKLQTKKFSSINFEYLADLDIRGRTISNNEWPIHTLGLTMDMKTGEKLLLDDIIEINDALVMDILYTEGFATYYYPIDVVVERTPTLVDFFQSEDIPKEEYENRVYRMLNSDTIKELDDEFGFKERLGYEGELTQFFLTENELIITDLFIDYKYDGYYNPRTAVSIPKENLKNYLKIKW